MNGRILKIAQQTDIWCDQNYSGDDHYDQRWELQFAELIVRECAGVVQNAVDHREPASTYVDKIKQHFGVE